MRVGVHTGLQNCTFADLSQLWQEVEDVGFDWISVWDHFYPASLTDLGGDCFEAVAAHSALAALTRHVRVGCLVYSAGYRHPGVLANAAATIDHVSGGRLELGIGAGWLQPEYDAYGIPFEPPAVRIRRLDETIRIVRSLWAEETTDFDGEFYCLHDAYCAPKPVQEHPRIWVGGWGEKRMLPLVGRLADAWNAPFVSPQEWGRKLELIREHAATAGRDPAEITASANIGVVLARTDAEVEAKRSRLTEMFGPLAQVLEPGILIGTPAAVADQAGAYVDAGADWLMLAVRAPFDRESLELFAADVLPQLPR